MTDEKLIEMLKKIKEYCRKLDSLAYVYTINPCENCQFYFKHPTKRKNICQITNLLGNMTSQPRYWDIERLEKIIKGETE